MKEACATGGVPDQMKEMLKNVKDSMEDVKHKILVLSGKGGVGKSTVTYLLAKALAEKNRVGVIDLDLCGPSMPLLFNTPVESLHQTAFGFEPCYAAHNIGVVSIQYFLEHDDDAVIARGPRKNSLILQFLCEVDWGETDFIVVDTPPGTSDEHMSIVSFMSESGIDGAVIVTTPEEVALADVRREIRFCQRAGVKVLGVIENMSSFQCPKCNKESSVYPTTTGGAAALCEQENIPLLARLPLSPALVAGCAGENYAIEETIQKAIHHAIDELNGLIETNNVE